MNADDPGAKPRCASDQIPRTVTVDPSGTTFSSTRLPSRSASPSAMRMSLRIAPSWSVTRPLKNESTLVMPRGSNGVPRR